MIALNYENGTGVPQDSVRAKDYYIKACDAGDAASCGRVGPPPQQQ
jgi:TPR repeat protein